MGKPSDIDANPLSPSPAGLGEPSGAISLHTRAAPLPLGRRPGDEYFDDSPRAEYDDDDLPPLYTDHEEYSTPFDPLVPRGANQLVQPFGHTADGTTVYYVDSRLDSDPAFLLDHINRLAAVPPRPFVRLRGTHKERRRGHDKSRHGSEDVVDFDIRIELTHLLYTDIRTQQSWCGMVTAGNFEKVRRGTVLAARAPGFGGGGGGAAEDGVPDLEQWCHRFCSSSAGLKCFTFERRIEGWDWDLIQRRLEALVRATNYRGHAVVTFPVRNARVDVYNDCRTNRWRLTSWICLVFYATLLFLVAWPWLLLRTKRWETAAAEWHMSRPTSVPGRRQYASMSEEQWYGMWAKAVQRAMLERRDGELDQGDLERAQGETVVGEGGLAGAVRAGVEAMGVVNRSFGWGGDQC